MTFTIFTFLVIVALAYGLRLRVLKQRATHLRPSPPRITDLRVYPIKSCRGFSVTSTRLTPSGLDLDRNWMFATIIPNSPNTREFMTLRQEPRMALIHTTLNAADDLLIVTIPSRADVRLEVSAHPSIKCLEQYTTLVSDASIWGASTDAWEYPHEWTKPFAEFLGRYVRLLYKGPTPRYQRGNATPQILGRAETFAFADMAAILVSNEASLEDLNQRLQRRGKEHITMEYFRPNIVVSEDDLQAWDEDSWSTVRISGSDVNEGSPLSVALDVVSRCLRCQVPNFDPETGVKDREEPWNTLMKFRNVDSGNKHKPCFGMLCVPREGGFIHVGDLFHVEKTVKEHVFLKNPPAQK